MNKINSANEYVQTISGIIEKITPESGRVAKQQAIREIESALNALNNFANELNFHKTKSLVPQKQDEIDSINPLIENITKIINSINEKIPNDQKNNQIKNFQEIKNTFVLIQKKAQKQLDKLKEDGKKPEESSTPTEINKVTQPEVQPSISNEPQEKSETIQVTAQKQLDNLNKDEKNAEESSTPTETNETTQPSTPTETNETTQPEVQPSISNEQKKTIEVIQATAEEQLDNLKKEENKPKISLIELSKKIRKDGLTKKSLRTKVVPEKGANEEIKSNKQTAIAALGGSVFNPVEEKKSESTRSIPLSPPEEDTLQSSTENVENGIKNITPMKDEKTIFNEKVKELANLCEALKTKYSEKIKEEKEKEKILKETTILPPLSPPKGNSLKKRVSGYFSGNSIELPEELQTLEDNFSSPNTRRKSLLSKLNPFKKEKTPPDSPTATSESPRPPRKFSLLRKNRESSDSLKINSTEVTPTENQTVPSSPSEKTTRRKSRVFSFSKKEIILPETKIPELPALPDASINEQIIQALDLIKILLNREDVFEIEGIFRVSGLSNRVNELKNPQALGKDYQIVNNSIKIENTDEIHAVIGAIKALLRDNPLISDPQAAKNFFNSDDIIDNKQKGDKIKEFINKLKPDEKNLLKIVINLSLLISDNHKINKMTRSNLSIIIGQIIVEAPTGMGAMESMSIAQKQNNLALFIMDNYEDIFSE
jgi:hypothetical protein